jgi:hypothetical protein
MATFKVKGEDGEMLNAEQLATFAAYVGAEQFQFVVTRLPHQFDVALTHRASGSRVVRISHMSIHAARGDFVVAGKATLTALVDKHGVARVAAVLRADAALQ